MKHPFFNLVALSKRSILILFFAKLGFGFFLQAVYTYYYTDRKLADVYKYYDDATLIFNQRNEHPTTVFQIVTGINFNKNNPETLKVLKNTSHFDKRNVSFFDANHRLMIRLNVLFLFVSGSNVFTHVLFFSFLAFLGMFLILKRLEQIQIAYSKPCFLAFLLLPSVGFWSSGMLKESLMYFFLGILVYSIQPVFKLKMAILTLLSALLIFYLKPIVLILCLLIYFVVLFKNTKLKLSYKYLIIICLIVLSVLYNIPESVIKVIVGKRNQFIELAHKYEAKSLTDSDYLEANFQTVAKLFPKAFVDGVCKPILWQSFSKPIDLLFSLELMLIFILVIYSLIHKGFYSFLSRHKIYYFMLFFSLLYMILLGYIIPIVGAIVRYKVIVLPFFVMPFIHFISLNPKIRTLSSFQKLKIEAN